MITPVSVAALDAVLASPIFSRQARNGAAIVNIAQHGAGLEVDDLARAINADPETARCFVEALRAAEFTASAEKLQALGLSVAALLTDTAQVDEEAWFIRQVAGIETYHIRVLKCWDLTDAELEAALAPGATHGNRTPLGWSAAELRQRSGLAMAPTVARELTRLGFLRLFDPTAGPIMDTGYDYANLPMSEIPLHSPPECWVMEELGFQLLNRVRASSLPRQ